MRISDWSSDVCSSDLTTLQKVVPFARQGRVFGFAQSVELAASPLTAFLIAPLTQFVFVPLMTTGWGAEATGDRYGRGPERGIALGLSIAGLLAVLATAAAFASRSSQRNHSPTAVGPDDGPPHSPA